MQGIYGQQKMHLLSCRNETHATFNTSNPVKILAFNYIFFQRVRACVALQTDLPSMMVMTSFILICSLSSSSKSCSALISVGMVCKTHTHTYSLSKKLQRSGDLLPSSGDKHFMSFCMIMIHLFPLVFARCLTFWSY